MPDNTKDISSQDRPATPAVGSPRVLIAGGGTGGHVYPAIAIANALREQNRHVQILFVGTKDHLEWEVVPRAGYNIVSIWISGFHRRLTLKNLLFPLKVLVSLMQSLKIIFNFKPDAAVSCGGYAAGPACWVAAKRAVPLAIQEQNSYPGATNRLLARNASKIFTAFKDADHFFPKEKTILAGNPTRKNLTDVDKAKAYRHFEFSPRRKTILVLGGSGGAKTINESMKEHIEMLHDELDLQIIWQCGQRYYDQLTSHLDLRHYKNLQLTDFIYNMAEAYAIADLVISRAGALSCSELQLTGKPSILVPSPNVAGNHQMKNARSMAEEGAAEILEDSKAGKLLGSLVKELISDQQRLHFMQQAALKLSRPNAADQIAEKILEMTNQNHTDE